jgi:hypothetical protein
MPHYPGVLHYAHITIVVRNIAGNRYSLPLSAFIWGSPGMGQYGKIVFDWRMKIV